MRQIGSAWIEENWIGCVFLNVCNGFTLISMRGSKLRISLTFFCRCFFRHFWQFLLTSWTQAVPFGTAIATAWCDLFAFWSCELRHGASALYRARVVRHGPWDTWPVCQINERSHEVGFFSTGSCFRFFRSIFLWEVACKAFGICFCYFLCLHLRNQCQAIPSWWPSIWGRTPAFMGLLSIGWMWLRSAWEPDETIL